MAGIIIPLFSMRTFTFAATGEVPIIPALDVRQWSTGALLMRAHTNGNGTGSKLEVVLRIAAPSAQDPSNEFVYAATDVARTTIADSTTDPAPRLKWDNLIADFGGYLQVVVVGTKGSGACTAKLSADLSAKD